MSLIELKNVKKDYVMGEVTVPAIRGIDLTIEKGQFIVILGPSGCGKTTLLNLIGGMDQATEGEIRFNNESSFNLSKMQESKLTNYRRKYVGFVFQFYNLVHSLTALENVELAAHLTQSDHDASAIAKRLLEEVGLGDKMNKFPGQLSGGEQQRVSIARSLAKQPKILLADEPTGSNDTETTGKILKLLREINKIREMTMLIVTHNVGISYLADKVIYLRDGKIYGTSDHDSKKEAIFWEELHHEPENNAVSSE